MQVIRDPLRQTDLPRGGVGTIGNFDSVHLGHRRILSDPAVIAEAVAFLQDSAQDSAQDSDVSEGLDLSA